jgi:type IV pilus assembly protein PilP
MKFINGSLVILTFFALNSNAQTTDPALAPPQPHGVPGLPAQTAPPVPPPLPPSASGHPAEGPNTQNQNVQGPDAKTQNAKGQSTKVEEVRTILQGIFEDYKYDPIGKRDPFLPYNAPAAVSDCGPFEECDSNALERFDLDQLKLVGIIWDVKQPKAMFVDPSNKTHVVGEQEKVGRNNGYIAEIREGELVIIEKFYNLGRFTYQTRVLKLQRE